jgi:hypothetical protein
MSSVVAKPFDGYDTLSALPSCSSRSDQIVKIKLSNEQPSHSLACKKIITKNSILPSNFNIKKIFNKALATINQFHWMESLVILGACVVSLTLGGHCMYGFIVFAILLFLLLLCDNICFICF